MKIPSAIFRPLFQASESIFVQIISRSCFGKSEAMIKRYVLQLSNLFTETTPYFEFVESCLRHKSEMVIYEAANAIVNLKRTTSRELIPAISVLQLFCSSPKATMRFAAVRTLNQVSLKRKNNYLGPLQSISLKVLYQSLVCRRVNLCRF